MKKITTIITLFLSLISLFGCDYAEKSFQMMDGLPNQVTMDFELEIGYYGTFEWTSDNEDVITIDNQSLPNWARISQLETDVEVTLTATIRNKSKHFVIKVLKIGTEPTLLEQSTLAIQSLVIPEEAIIPFELPKSIGNIHFSYHKPYDGRWQHFEIIDEITDTIWILPNIVDYNKDTFIFVRTYYLNEDNQKISIDSKEMSFRVVVDQDVIHPHLKVFQAIEIVFADGDHRDHVTRSFKVPISSTINESAQLSWQRGQSGIGVLILDSDGENVLIFEKPGTHNVSLWVTITIDGLWYIFEYPITVCLDE